MQSWNHFIGFRPIHTRHKSLHPNQFLCIYDHWTDLDVDIVGPFHKKYLLGVWNRHR